MRLFVLAFLLPFVITTAKAQGVQPTCAHYGCSDCSCVASKTEVQMHNFLKLFMKNARENRIPLDAVALTVKGYKGPDKSVEEEVDGVVVTDGCSLDCLCCKWTFRVKP